MPVVQFEQIGAVAVIRMNRPDQRNALNLAMHREITACYARVNDDDTIRAAVLTGNGPYFCSGRDVKELATRTTSGSRELRPMEDPESPQFGLYAMKFEVTKPLVAAVNGPVLAGGLSMLLLADIVVMAETATLADGHARASLRGLPWLMDYLPAMVGRELMLTNRALTARECVQWGLANRTAPAGDVLAEAINIAEEIASMPPEGIRQSKALSLARQHALGQIETAYEREARRERAKQAR